MDYSPEPINLGDYTMECTECGNTKQVLYTSQLNCPECGNTKFRPA